MGDDRGPAGFVAAPIWAAASHAYIAAHIAPVWEALPLAARGRFVGPLGSGADDPVGDVAGALRGSVSGPVLVACRQDFAAALDAGRLPILMEHGTGQTYEGAASFHQPGGRGRELAAIYLAPGPFAAAAHRCALPWVPVVEIGCPRLDRWIGRPAPRGSPTVAISVRPCVGPLGPESGGAVEAVLPGLAGVRAALGERGVALLGHAHPSRTAEQAPIYRAAGVEFEPDIDALLARAQLLVADNTSLLFEFAALGRPVVLLHAPQWRREVAHGLRFWHAEAMGPVCESPTEIADAVADELASPARHAEAREAVARLAYGSLDGRAAERAVQAALRVAGWPPTIGYG